MIALYWRTPRSSSYSCLPSRAKRGVAGLYVPRYECHHQSMPGVVPCWTLKLPFNRRGLAATGCLKTSGWCHYTVPRWQRLSDNHRCFAVELGAKFPKDNSPSKKEVKRCIQHLKLSQFVHLVSRGHFPAMTKPHLNQ